MAYPTFTLNDASTLPAIGLGTYGLRDGVGIDAMVSAIEAGYTLLDTALNYENEREVGEAVRRSEIRPLVATKLPGRHHGYDETLRSFDESIGNLGLDHVDLYLIHWPNPSVDKYADSWRAMIELQKQGRVTSIGVSNFTAAFIERLEAETGVLPAVNQIELHPRFSQPEMRAFHASKGILTQSWSPLARRKEVTGEPVIEQLAAKHGKTPTQVVLRWHHQLGALPIPKSANPQRQRENIDIFDFELSDDDLAQVATLESERLWGGDPLTHEEM
jgi:diketogulonate reductase-like aldo/keto reductase